MRTLFEIVGIVLPLFTIAGSAFAYVFNYIGERKRRRADEFAKLIQIFDTEGQTASKISAIYHLRQFPEHSDFIMSLCARFSSFVKEGDRDMLHEHFQQTLNYFLELDANKRHCFLRLDCKRK